MKVRTISFFGCGPILSETPLVIRVLKVIRGRFPDRALVPFRFNPAVHPSQVALFSRLAVGGLGALGASPSCPPSSTRVRALCGVFTEGAWEGFGVMHKKKMRPMRPPCSISHIFKGLSSGDRLAI